MPVSAEAQPALGPAPAAAAPAPERIGILLVNSGTPQAPEPRAVRAFLRRFLADPRVVELPRLVWLPLLYGLVLPLRPRRVARKYRLIWSPEGAPLRHLSEALGAAVSAALAQRALAPLSLEVAMLYSPPELEAALARLRAAGARRILALPLFPQYCGATSGAVFDRTLAGLRGWRALPDLQFISDYHDHPGYIEALRGSVAEYWQREGRAAHLLMSFHGVPARLTAAGDPYQRQCLATARLLADELLLQEGEWSVSFQSRFGPATWLTPATSDALGELARRGVRSVSVLCPGFAVDCLETLEEIALENRDVYLRAGGTRYSYIPALNARPAHAQALAELIVQHCRAWTPLGPDALVPPRGGSA
ncbi:MAG: ferrochelatase [Gammaproteobacteria bacterium]|nr:ferrochelatase [Gammaproteobacteria bacterium]